MVFLLAETVSSQRCTTVGCFSPGAVFFWRGRRVLLSGLGWSEDSDVAWWRLWWRPLVAPTVRASLESISVGARSCHAETKTATQMSSLYGEDVQQWLTALRATGCARREPQQAMWQLWKQSKLELPTLQPTPWPMKTFGFALICKLWISKGGCNSILAIAHRTQGGRVQSVSRIRRAGIKMMISFTRMQLLCVFEYVISSTTLMS